MQVIEERFRISFKMEWLKRHSFFDGSQYRCDRSSPHSAFQHYDKKQIPNNIQCN